MNNIKKFRLDLDLTQEDLADLLFLDQSTLSKYERNVKQPSFGVCYRLIRILREKGFDTKIEEIRQD